MHFLALVEQKQCRVSNRISEHFLIQIPMLVFYLSRNDQRMEYKVFYTDLEETIRTQQVSGTTIGTKN